MSEETKSKILNAMEKLNYSPNSVAQSLKKKKTKVVGILLSDISNPFWAEVLKGVQHECMKSGYALMVNSSGEDPNLEKDNVDILKSKQVDGLIINPTGMNTSLYKQLNDQEFPFVFLDRFPGEMMADTVIVNNVLGASRSIQHLINEGHRRIGIMLYPMENKSPRIDRLKGYKKALNDHGIPIDESLVKVCEQVRGEGVNATRQMLSLNNRPTAIFSTNSILNLEILAGVKEEKLRVPEDVSLIGYDDFPWVPLLDPPLSTVRQPAYKLGEKAAQTLIRRMEEKESSQKQIFQLEPELIIRNSSAPPG